MANDIVYILPNPGGSSDSAHVIGMGECIEFNLGAISCEVQFSAAPSRTNPVNVPHTGLVYTLSANSIFQFYFDKAETIVYEVDPSGQGVPGGGHTVIVGGVGKEGR
jgi:hypothetical protein